jgi:ribosome maturation factor RimP
MVDIQDIKKAVAEILGAADVTGKGTAAVTGKGTADATETGGGLFLIEVTASGDAFDITVDSDNHVSIDDCAKLTHALTARFDREQDDFALTVSSAGIGQPLRHPRQYKKLVSKSVEVILATGTKIIGTLEAADENSITLSYPEKQKTQGAKRPVTVNVTKTLPLTDIKTTKEFIDFK